MLGWVTIYRYSSHVCTFLIFSHPPRLTQPGHPPGKEFTFFTAVASNLECRKSNPRFFSGLNSSWVHTIAGPNHIPHVEFYGVKFMSVLWWSGHFIWWQPDRSRRRQSWSPRTQLLDVSTRRRHFRASIQRWFLATSLGENLCRGIIVCVHEFRCRDYCTSGRVKTQNLRSKL